MAKGQFIPFKPEEVDLLKQWTVEGLTPREMSERLGCERTRVSNKLVALKHKAAGGAQARPGRSTIELPVSERPGMAPITREQLMAGR